jgi:hypothetical protein
MKPRRTFLPESAIDLAASDDQQAICLISYCLSEAVKGLEACARMKHQVRPLRDKLKDNLPPDAFAKWTQAELAQLDAHDRDDEFALDRLPPIKSRAARRVAAIRY